MDVAVCEGRAVVEHKFRRIFPELLNLFIEADFLPMLYARGFRVLQGCRAWGIAYSAGLMSF